MPNCVDDRLRRTGCHRHTGVHWDHVVQRYVWRLPCTWWTGLVPTPSPAAVRTRQLMMVSCCPDVRRAVDAGTNTSGTTRARCRASRMMSATDAAKWRPLYRMPPTDRVVSRQRYHSCVLTDIKAIQLVTHSAQRCFAYDNVAIDKSTGTESRSKGSLCYKSVSNATNNNLHVHHCSNTVQ